jgi:hypothetical protein
MKSKKPQNNTPKKTEETEVLPDSSLCNREMLPHYIQAVIATAAILSFLLIAYQMIVSTRAWITVKGAELIELKEGQPITAKIIFRNSGKSPALEVSVYNNINLYGQKVPDPMPYGHYAGHLSKSVTGPDSDFGNFITKKEILTPQELEAIIHHKAAIYVYGRIEYRDIFHCRRTTEYCMVNKYGTLNFDACEKNNTAN